MSHCLVSAWWSEEKIIEAGAVCFTFLQESLYPLIENPPKFSSMRSVFWCHHACWNHFPQLDADAYSWHRRMLCQDVVLWWIIVWEVVKWTHSSGDWCSMSHMWNYDEQNTWLETFFFFFGNDLEEFSFECQTIAVIESCSLKCKIFTSLFAVTTNLGPPVCEYASFHHWI